MIHQTYTVQSMDTLTEIGARFGVPYMAIAALNHLADPDLIFPGQRLKLPAAKSPSVEALTAANEIADLFNPGFCDDGMVHAFAEVIDKNMRRQ